MVKGAPLVVAQLSGTGSVVQDSGIDPWLRDPSDFV